MTQPPAFDPNQQYQPGPEPSNAPQIPASSGPMPPQYGHAPYAQPASGQPPYGYGQPPFVQHGYPQYYQPQLPYPQLAGAGLTLAIASLVVAVLVILAGFLPFYTFNNYGGLVEVPQNITGYQDLMDEGNAGGFTTSAWAFITLVLAIITVTMRQRGIALANGVVAIASGGFIALYGAATLLDAIAAQEVWADLGVDVGMGSGAILVTALGVVLAVIGILQLVFLPKRPIFRA